MGVWKNLGAIKESNHLLGLQECHWRRLVPVGRGLLARYSDRSVSFIRMPCATAGRRGVEEWTVEPPVTPFRPIGFAVYSPEDVLAFVELSDS